jgi:putative oxidoreductase
MLRKFLATNDEVSLLILRLGLGIVMLPHGLQKTLGLFGGNGFAGTYGFFTDKMGVPGVAAVLVILAESLGALGLIFGALTRLGALGIVAVMTGANAMVHWQNGFFMNWSGKQAGEGFEYHLLVVGMALALVISGGGKWSLDHLLAKKQ